MHHIKEEDKTTATAKKAASYAYMRVHVISCTIVSTRKIIFLDYSLLLIKIFLLHSIICLI